MKKIKPLVFICAGLMAIATLYGAFDLAKAKVNNELDELYVEQKDHVKQVEKIKVEKDEAAPTVVEEKVLPKENQKTAVNKGVKKQKRKTTKPVPVEVYNKPVEEKIELKEKELEWESFSRKAVNKKFKKVITQVDTVTKGSFAVTKD